MQLGYIYIKYYNEIIYLNYPHIGGQNKTNCGYNKRADRRLYKNNYWRDLKYG